MGKNDKYDDYVMSAIGMEGSDNWPSQWTEECDESFKEYKKQIDKGKKVDADAFLDKQKVIFSKMSQAERARCYVYSTKSRKFPRKRWRKTRRNSRRFLKR
jgi:hypothetical protein